MSVERARECACDACGWRARTTHSPRPATARATADTCEGDARARPPRPQSGERTRLRPKPRRVSSPRLPRVAPPQSRAGCRRRTAQRRRASRAAAGQPPPRRRRESSSESDSCSSGGASEREREREEKQRLRKKRSCRVAGVSRSGRCLRTTSRAARRCRGPARRATGSSLHAGSAAVAALSKNWAARARANEHWRGAATFGSRRVVLCPLVASKQRRCGHAALSIADVIDARAARGPRPVVDPCRPAGARRGVTSQSSGLTPFVSCSIAYTDVSMIK